MELETNAVNVGGEIKVGEALRILTSFGKVEAVVSFLPSTGGHSGNTLEPTPSLPTYSHSPDATALSTKRHVTVNVVTSDAPIDLTYSRQPSNIQLIRKASTRGEIKVLDTPRSGFSSVASVCPSPLARRPQLTKTPQATTSLTATAVIDAEEQKVEWLKRKSNEVIAVIRGGEGGDGGRSEATTGASGLAEIVVG